MPTPVEWAAVAAWAQVGVLLLTLLYIAKQVKEARDLRMQQSRPYVIVEIEPTFPMWLVIQNVGATMATNVSVRFDPPLTPAGVKPDWEDSLAEPIPSLAPNRRLRWFFGVDHEVLNADTPLVYTAALSYDDYRGKPAARDERITSDLRRFIGVNVERDPLDKLARELAEVKKTLKGWTEGGKLQVRHKDREKESARRHRPYHLRRMRDLRRESGVKAAVAYWWEDVRRRRGWYVR